MPVKKAKIMDYIGRYFEPIYPPIFWKYQSNEVTLQGTRKVNKNWRERERCTHYADTQLHKGEKERKKRKSPSCKKGREWERWTGLVAPVVVLFRRTCRFPLHHHLLLHLSFFLPPIFLLWVGEWNEMSDNPFQLPIYFNLSRSMRPFINCGAMEACGLRCRAHLLKSKPLKINDPPFLWGIGKFYPNLI